MHQNHLVVNTVMLPSIKSRSAFSLNSASFACVSIIHTCTVSFLLRRLIHESLFQSISLIKKWRQIAVVLYHLPYNKHRGCFIVTLKWWLWSITNSASIRLLLSILKTCGECQSESMGHSVHMTNGHWQVYEHFGKINTKIGSTLIPGTNSTY